MKNQIEVLDEEKKTAPIAITSCQQYLAVDTAGSTSPTFPFLKTLAVTTLPEWKEKKGRKVEPLLVLNRLYALICDKDGI